MENCPNCGSPVRPGAKFCTTCGFRLPEGEDTAPAAETASEVPAFDPVGTMAAEDWSTGGAPETASPPPETAGDEAAPSEADREVTSEAAARREGAPTGTTPETGPLAAGADAGWQAPVGQAWPGWDAPATTATEEGGEAAEAAATEGEVGTEGAPAEGAEAGEDRSWAGAAERVETPAAEDAADWGAATADDLAPSEARAGEAEPGWQTTEAEGWGTAAAPWGAAEEPAVEVGTAADTEQPGFGETAPEGGDEVPTAVGVVGGVTGVEQPMTDAGVSLSERLGQAGELVDRATAALDDLRRLLPDLEADLHTAAAPAPLAFDAEAIAVELETARREAREGREFAGLEAVLLAARDRPRDIDAMLQLTGRLEEILALHGAYGRCAAAIDAAVAALRGNLPSE
jgi:hypothetical protein